MSLQIVKLIDPTAIVTGGLVPKGAYAGGTTYAVGDSVSYNGSSYVCILASTGNLPTNTTYWQLLASIGATGATGATGSTGATGAAGVVQSIVAGTNISVDSSTPSAPVVAVTGLTKSTVGLANVDNTSDLNKPISTATQTALDAKQSLDSTLTSLAAYNTNGLLTQTAADTFTGRTLTGTTNQITVTNGDGVSGNPTLSTPQNIHTGATPTFGGITTTGTTAVPLNLISTAGSGSGSGAGILAISDDGAALASGDRLGYMLFGGAYDTFSSRYNSTGIIAYTTESWGGAARGAMIDFVATPTGTITRSNVLRLNANGASGAQFYGHAYPNADSAYTLGTSSLYWSNTYTDRLYLNSTAYIDGASAGTLNVGAGSLGILATSGAATHSLTLGSTATGIALYNTSDQTVNYERVRHYWTGNVYTIGSEIGGTGTTRVIRLGLFSNTGLYLNTSVTLTQGLVQSRLDASWADATVHSIGGALSASSGLQNGLLINPVYTQSGTAGYTALKINTTETTVGSGTKLLADFQVGSVSKFSVSNAGKVNVNNVQSIYVPDQTNFTGSMFFGQGGSSLSHVTGSDGMYNLAVGKSALNAITTGNVNVALGFTTLANLTTGTNNMGIGEGALSGTISSSNNVGIGAYALYSGTGSSNIGIGAGTGNGITSGSSNVIVGHNSGRFLQDGTTVTTTLNNSTLLGHNAFPKANNETNETVIGYTAIGNGSNTVTIGNSSVTDNYIAGNFNITNANNIVLGTTTGTKIGTATTQKLSLWNATPIVQPTTAIAAATFVAGAGTAVNDASTFDGYTMGQIVKALRNIGALA